MLATMDIPFEAIHTWDVAKVTKIMAEIMVTMSNIWSKHRNIITLYWEVTMLLFDDDLQMEFL
jgi:hypothetical protein